MNKRSLFLIALFVGMLLSTGYRALAQDSAAPPVKSDSMPRRLSNNEDSPVLTDEDIQLFRKDVRSVKKQVIAANMNLTDIEAEKFWPIYEQYTTDLAKIYDTKAGLIKDYLQNYTTMTGDQAEDYIRKRGAVEQSVTAFETALHSDLSQGLDG